MTLASEGRRDARTIDDAVARIDAARALTARTSTQENAWLVLAARALAKQVNAISLSVNGDARQGALYRSLRAERARRSRWRSSNTRRRRGAGGGVGLRRADDAGAGGRTRLQDRAQLLHARRRAGRSSKAKQNQRFVVVLKITEPAPQFGRIIVADYLPAGFEIDNPRLVSSGETGTLAWIADAVEPVNSEFRDDRFTAAFDREHNRRRCSRSPTWCARCRRATTCCRRRWSRTCTGPTASAAPAPGTIEVTAGK